MWKKHAGGSQVNLVNMTGLFAYPVHKILNLPGLDFTETGKVCSGKLVCKSYSHILVVYTQ